MQSTSKPLSRYDKRKATGDPVQDIEFKDKLLSTIRNTIRTELNKQLKELKKQLPAITDQAVQDQIQDINQIIDQSMEKARSNITSGLNNKLPINSSIASSEESNEVITKKEPTLATLSSKRIKRKCPGINKFIRNYHKDLQKNEEGWDFEKTFGDKNNEKVTREIDDYIWENYEIITGIHVNRLSAIDVSQKKDDIKIMMSAHFSYLKSIVSTV